MNRLSARRIAGTGLVLLTIWLGVVLLSLNVGSVHIPVWTSLRILKAHLMGTRSPAAPLDSILLSIRLPRVFLGSLVGAALAAAGTAFQSLLRNPLADPYVLGVSSGAAVGSIVALLIENQLSFSPAFAGLFTPLGASIGAGAAIAAVYFLGRRDGRIDSSTLLLSGIIASSFLSAIVMFLMSTLSGGNLRGYSYWLMGSFSTLPPPSLLYLLGIGFLVAAGAIYTTASDLNLLLAGEKEAMHLGVDVHRVQIVVYVAASILTGLAVSVSGAIGYVGLLIPHGMRLIFGSDHRMLLPASALGGAIALVIADTAARTVVAPSEVQVGAVTAVIGAPFFIYLLRRGLK